MNQSVLYAVPFIKAVNMGGDATTGPSDIFISYLFFIIQTTCIYQSLSSEAWN